MAVVTFDPVAFVARYPEFASVAPSALLQCFNEATIHCNNTDTSRVTDVTRRAVLLNMLTAHIAELGGLRNAVAGPSGMVGRVDSAGEGSVSAHATYANNVSGSMAWFVQTKYGADYWAATRSFRTMQYRQFPRC